MEFYQWNLLIEGILRFYYGSQQIQANILFRCTACSSNSNSYSGSCLCCYKSSGHGRFCHIDEILEHHEDRLNEIMEALRENPDSDAYVTASKVTWSMKGLKWEEAPDGQKWFAMGETVAHLDYLMFQGKVVKTKVDGVSRYRLV